MRNHQHGTTFIGLLCILALAGVVVYAGIRLAPLYLNYMKVAKIMESTASEVKHKGVEGDVHAAAKSEDQLHQASGGAAGRPYPCR